MGILLDILSGIGNTLDVPGSMVRDTLGGENPFDQLMAPWRGDNRLSGRDLLRRRGWASQEDTWGNLAGGIGIELATDPMNLLAGAGLLRRAFQGAKIAKATRAVDEANTLSQALRAKGWMPEEVAQATKIRGVTQTPDKSKFFAREIGNGRWQIVQSSTGDGIGSVIANSADDAMGKANSVIQANTARLKPYEFISREGPLTLYHETAAPPFGLREFLRDPGTRNWLGKGTYFTKQPGEAAGAYSVWDKSKTILPSDPVEAKRIADALAAKGAGAPRTMMGYVDSRNPFTFEEPATLRDMLMAARATRESKYTRQLLAVPRKIGLTNADDTMMSIRRLQNKQRPTALRAIKKEISDAEADIDYLNKMGPDMDDTDWYWKVDKLEREKKFAEHRLDKALHGERDVVTKGEIWSLLNQTKNPDEITDILRASGYDAIQHEAGQTMKLQDRMHEIGRRPPDIDEHSELVVFDPSNIYEPFIAPALQARPEQLKRIPRSLKAAFAGYQAGVSPTRGWSQE